MTVTLELSAGSLVPVLLSILAVLGDLIAPHIRADWCAAASWPRTREVLRRLLRW